ncbi:MAG: LuxR C-terminal-related transcriptional regulator [Coriobacteriaceae bacterium]|jgi:DNA-binding CsgD family transcriptional regulator|nr:LuxR C-terminal-related transcriptional regulator [Coriobacteriaceae bacterium]
MDEREGARLETRDGIEGQRHRSMDALSGLGLGCVWSWTFILSRAESWLAPGLPAPYALTFNMGWLIVLTSAVFLASFLRQRLLSKDAKSLFLVLGFVLALATSACYLSVYLGGLLPREGHVGVELEAMVGGISLIIGLSWACGLVSWAQCNTCQEPSSTVRRISVALVVSGLLFLSYWGAWVPGPLYAFVLPCVWSCCFFFARPHARRKAPEEGLAEVGRRKAAEEDLVEGDSDKGRDTGDLAGTNNPNKAQKEGRAASTLGIPRSGVALHAAIIGFMWGVFPQGTIAFQPVDWALGNLMAGCLFLFLAVFLRSALDLGIVSVLVAVVVSVVTMIALFFPADSAYSPYLMIACFEAAYLVILSDASARGRARGSEAVSLILRAIALYCASILLGLCFGLALGGFPQLILLTGLGALLVALGTAIAKRLRFPEAPPLRSIPDTADDPEEETQQDLGAEDPSGHGFAIPTRHGISLAEKTSLTTRENEVLLMLAHGHTLSHIAQELCLSENTVKKHRANIYMKLGIHKRQELINLLDGD